MHINMSLFMGAKNAFYDKNDPEHRSSTARYFHRGFAARLTLVYESAGQLLLSVPG